MRVLFASTRGAGHYFPLLPFMDALRRHGHEVLVAGPRELEARVAADGYPFWLFGDPPEDELAAAWARVPSLPWEEAETLVLAEIFGRLRTTASLPRLVEACETWRPDVVVREQSQYASALAAELRGIPHARVGFGPSSTEELAIGIVAPAIDAIRRDTGLGADAAGDALRHSPYLTCTPASLEDASVPMQPRTFRFRDPAWDAPAAPLPAWWADDSQPLVYVTFGSVAGGEGRYEAVYAAALEAVAGLPARVLLTTGRGLETAALPTAPPNVHVEPWVPQADVLAHSAAVVHHGGAGSTLGALAAGLPAVVVPLFADQPLNARAVAVAGAGVVVEEPTADALRAALARVLDDPSYAQAARRIAAELRSYPPTDDAVAFLATIAGRVPWGA